MEFRVRQDGSIRLPAELADGLKIYPGSRIRVTRDGDRLVIEKVAGPEDPFAAAAKGPDLEALDRIREQQAKDQQKARDRFEEMMKKPPEVRPEDTPDFWR